MTATTNHKPKQENEVIDEILSPKQAEIWQLLNYNDDVHELLIGGSAGGGKSFLICLWQIYRRVCHPGTRGLIGRLSYTNLLQTTLKTFIETWNKFGRHNPFGVDMVIIGNTARFSNGSEILFRWLKETGTKNSSTSKDQTDLGSLELTDAAIDEVTEVPRRTVKILNSRIRYKLINGVPKLAMTCNPSICWVKWDWIKTKKGTPVILKSYQRYCPFSLADNPDEEFRENYRQQLLKLEGADLLRLLYGDWDAVDNEKPWFHTYNYSEHTVAGRYVVDRFEPMLLSFDFNVEPMTVTAAQYTPERGLAIIRSHERDGTTAQMCEELLAYGYHKHPAGLTVTGDVSGKARHTAAGLTEYGEIATDYSAIKDAFNLSDDDIFHTGFQNPRLRYSRRIVNHAIKVGIIKFYREECGPLLEDIAAAMPGNGDNFIKTDEMGMHHGDNFRYLVHMVFPEGYDDVNNALLLLNFTTSNTHPPPTTNGNQSGTKDTSVVINQNPLFRKRRKL